MDLELQGKVALVTAASSGIGLAVVQRLVLEGAIVVASSRSIDHKSVTTTAQALGRLTSIAADLGNAADNATLIERVLALHGRLDILVLNTPGPKIVPFMETTLDDWSSAYDMLVRPCVQLARSAAANMVINRAGSIVFLTSTWVKQPAPGGVLSSTMRSALSALSKQMSLELAPYGVRVNQVQPGATGTARMHAILRAKAQTNGSSVERELEKVIENIPLGRWAHASEIADAVAFLVSPRSNFTTGSVLQVDGGAIRSML
jgi:3-oxoacyl-[acyl-carrier protein] reductase